MNIALPRYLDAYPLNVMPGFYDIDPKHTRVLFCFSHFGISRYWGEFVDPEGSLHLDQNDLTATVFAASLPVAKVMTNSLVLNSELLGRDWFDVERYPTIGIVSRHVERTGAKRAKFEVDITIRGVTASVVLDAHFTAGKVNPPDHAYTIGFEATGSINRSVFGMNASRALVSDEVQLVIGASMDFRGVRGIPYKHERVE